MWGEVDIAAVVVSSVVAGALSIINMMLLVWLIGQR